MGVMEKPGNCDYDIIIVGAGISGINAAYRVQTELPNHTYTILENRSGLGGTWDLFRYPGIRSDSDLHTFGFEWRPWKSNNPIASGDAILSYVKESAEEYGIDRKIQYHHKVTSTDWSTERQQWTAYVEADGKSRAMTARWIIWGTGYYNYEQPLEADIPGLSDFQGQVVHPQFWPEKLDYTNKKIVVIGSGATAITLIPALAKKASQVTMLQRSPSYLLGITSRGENNSLIHRYTPTWLKARLARWQHLIVPLLFYNFCMHFPGVAKRLLLRTMAQELPSSIPADPNFTPRYNPWEQRLCFCPNGDFFACLRGGNANVVTDTIRTVTANGIMTNSGKLLEADIIVSATGIKVGIVGGSSMYIDGSPFDPSSKYIWKGAMLQDLPNACVVIGYTNASWTPGADATALLTCRLLKNMQKKGVISATPRISESDHLTPTPMLNMKSTYLTKAAPALPKSGNKGPWMARRNYFVDYWVAQYSDLTKGLQFKSA